MVFGAIDSLLRSEYWIIEQGRKQLILGGEYSQKGIDTV
jgi:hypothetical protein